MLPRFLRLNNSQDINRLYRFGRRLENLHLRLFYRPTGKSRTQSFRFGVVVGKKQVPNTAQRNRLKRILRNHIYKLSSEVWSGFDLLTVIKSNAHKIPPDKLRLEFEEILYKAKLLKKNG